MASIKEEKYREWIFGTIRANGLVNLEDALNIGASKAGCSIDTVKRYLTKLTDRGSGELTVKFKGDNKFLAARPGQDFLVKKVALKIEKKAQQNTRRSARKNSPKAQI